MSKWQPRIGDPVKVRDDFEYGEWVGLDLWVVSLDLRHNGIDIGVVECWPPKLYDSMGISSVTDGFMIGRDDVPDDIVPRHISQELPGRIPGQDGLPMERPQNCTIALRERGEPAPRSGCHSCNHGGMLGCPYDRKKP